MPFGFRRGKGRGTGGRRRGFRDARGWGWLRPQGPVDPVENCICPKCGAIVPHRRGLPCFQTSCPNCKTSMTRQFYKV